LLTNFVELL